MTSRLQHQTSAFACFPGRILVSGVALFALVAASAFAQTATQAPAKPRDAAESTVKLEEAPRPENTTPDKAPTARQPPLLWQVKGKGEQMAYLLGSIHLGKAEFYPLPKPIESAYRASEAIAVEADVTETQTMSQAMKRGLYDPPNTLENSISKALVEDIKKVLPQPEAFSVINNMKPWLVTLTLASLEYQKLGLEPKNGIDLVFIERARKDNKPIVELESVNLQMQIFDSLTGEEQSAFLGQTIKEISTGEVKTVIGDMIDAWQAGDAEKLAHVMTRSFEQSATGERLGEKLLYSRNTGMADRVEEFIKSGKPHFVIVGAGHLVGKRSLLDKLRDRGYTIKRVAS